MVDLGVLPRPGVAHAAALHDCPAAMISASRNPFGDNGIKLFSAGGRKLSDEVEAALESELTVLTRVATPTCGRPVPRSAPWSPIRRR